MSRERFAPLRGSVGLAVGFVGIRMFWRAVTSGINPAALLAAASSALPFAALILGCGLAVSLLNPRRALFRARTLRVGRSLITALAVGLGSVRELSLAARDLHAAQRLRGSRRRATLLVPLLEHGIERAVGLAALLELRGFGALGRTVHGTSSEVVLEDVSVRFGPRVALCDVNARFTPGRITVLTGPTGGGKSTLLNTIAGLTEHLDGGTRNGRLTVCGVDRAVPVRETAALVGYLPQQLRFAFLGERVRDELDWTDTPKSATEFARPGISADRLIAELSAGEAVLLALSTSLHAEHRVLLLDEPLADLDAAHRALVVQELKTIADAGAVVIIAEHHTSELEALTPHWLQVVNGRVGPGTWRAPSAQLARHPLVRGTDSTVEFRQPRFEFRSEERRAALELRLPAGAIRALHGDNGAGKSSFLRGLAAPAAETLWVRGVDAASARPHPRHVALVPDEVRSFFVRETLDEELRFGDRIARAQPGQTAATLRALLRSSGIDDLLECHPRDLSTGSQRALAIALQLSHQPGLLLIDEPTRGLDPGARADMAEILRCVAETGSCVIVASHDRDWATALSPVSWEMHEGELRTTESCAPPRPSEVNS